MLNANDENGADKTNRYGKDIPDGDAFLKKMAPKINTKIGAKL